MIRPMTRGGRCAMRKRVDGRRVLEAASCGCGALSFYFFVGITGRHPAYNPCRKRTRMTRLFQYAVPHYNGVNVEFISMTSISTSSISLPLLSIVVMVIASVNRGY
ncbi:hypothetical protein B0I37DRAFT_12912 [Chaetomium sp. MPI-CAGE-AT-0009]|nr:hypothetical protein B0I37DRAFT_12912 [Chaetomium sp. MPI-CAGE-AT-0009]